MRIACLVALAVFACSSPSRNAAPTTQPTAGGGAGGGAPGDAQRSPLYPGGEPRFEGPSFKNDCGGDGDCRVGGCGGEVCTAEEGVNSVCVAYPDAPRDASCGCVRGQCVWYGSAGAGAAAGTGGGATAGQPCGDGGCAAGLECVRYVGIAGARGPTFTSCEIRCGGGRPCPDGQRCITIADGPGQVCRPR